LIKFILIAISARCLIEYNIVLLSWRDTKKITNFNQWNDIAE